jgi:hypothetical protein
MSIKTELVKTLQNLMNVYFGKVYTDSELKVSAKEVGSKVEIISADGSLQDAPDGDYVMTDGFSFSVKDGLIVSIVGQEAPVVEEVEAGDENEKASGSTETIEVKSEDEIETEPEVDSEMEAMKEKVVSLEQRLASIEEMLLQMQMQKESDTKAIEQFNTTVSELNSHIKTLAKVPVEFTKTSRTPQVEEDKTSKLSKLAEIFASNKK